MTKTQNNLQIDPFKFAPCLFIFECSKIRTCNQATSMKVIRRNEETNDIDEKSPFLERSIPVTRSPKVSGAGVQLSNSVANHIILDYTRL